MRYGLNPLTIIMRQESPDTTNTQQEFEEVMKEARGIFADKLKDYGASWRILRPLFTH
jgi:hypothetical protein